MNTRNKTVCGALLVAALMASNGAFAQGGGSSNGSSTGQDTGAVGTSGDQNSGAGARTGGQGGGTLMQKREQGMSADRPASSPQSTGKMSQ